MAAVEKRIKDKEDRKRYLEERWHRVKWCMTPDFKLSVEKDIHKVVASLDRLKVNLNALDVMMNGELSEECPFEDAMRSLAHILWLVSLEGAVAGSY